MSSTTIILLVGLAIVIVAVTSLRPGAAARPRQGQAVLYVVLLLAVVLGLAAFLLRGRL